LYYKRRTGAAPGICLYALPTKGGMNSARRRVSIVSARQYISESVSARQCEYATLLVHRQREICTVWLCVRRLVHATTTGSINTPTIAGVSLGYVSALWRINSRSATVFHLFDGLLTIWRQKKTPPVEPARFGPLLAPLDAYRTP